MKVSVVCCTYDVATYDAFCDTANSILRQTYQDMEFVIVVDGTEAVFEKVRQDYDGEEDVVLHCNDENRGLSASRNVGWELASGEIVAFIDDDAVADEQWVEKLIEVYEKRDAVSVGGQMVPDWVAGRPLFLPEEFYWLVGVTHRGFADGPQEVRNTNGSNISFRRDVLAELEGFNESLGRKGKGQIQAEETELCVRMRHETGQGTWYEPEAKVAHKIFEYRTRLRFLVKRAFWQGYSKRTIQTVLPMSDSVESDFLGQLLGKFIPHRVAELFRSPSTERAAQLGMLLVLTISVGVGYLYGMIK